LYRLLALWGTPATVARPSPQMRGFRAAGIPPATIAFILSYRMGVAVLQLADDIAPFLSFLWVFFAGQNS
jgi:hypothetical protein